MKYIQYIGILLGALYGLFYRILCDKAYFNRIFDFNIYSISFIWVLPVIIGLIPVLVAREEVLKSKWKQFTYPFFSVLLFFLFSLTSGFEDWLCILIIALPFLIAAGIAGLCVGWFLQNRKSKGLYTILVLPILLNPLEARLPNKRQAFTVSSAVVIKASEKVVWQHLIEVPEITEKEYTYGFFNYIGIPRPVRSELKMVNGELYRIGHFTGCLKLYESITELDSLHFVNFKIHLDKSELRDLPTDKHLLNSRYFSFENISYKVKRLADGQTKLILTCDYVIESKMNGYADFWAEQIIKDFEVRLLGVLKNKAERQVHLLQKH